MHAKPASITLGADPLSSMRKPPPPQSTKRTPFPQIKTEPRRLIEPRDDFLPPPPRDELPPPVDLPPRVDLLRDPHEDLSRGVNLSPRREPGLSKSFKWSLDNAATKISKYAQSAASHIKAIAHQVTEPRVSLFDGVVDRKLAQSSVSRDVPDEWFDAFHALPENSVVPQCKLEGIPKSFFIPWEGETIDNILPQVVFMVDQVVRRSAASEFEDSRQTIQIGGRLLITSHRLFIDPLGVDVKSYIHKWLLTQSGYISIPWLQIKSLQVFGDWLTAAQASEMQTLSLDSQTCFVDIVLKDSSLLGLYIDAVNAISAHSGKGLINWFSAVCKTRSQPGSVFAQPTFTAPSNMAEGKHFACFDPVKEYSRYGVTPEVQRQGQTGQGQVANGEVHLSTINLDFEICQSYPPLLPLPTAVSNTAIASIAGFRSRGRIPILSWRSLDNGASLWRCSQPHNAFSSCDADQAFILNHLHSPQVHSPPGQSPRGQGPPGQSPRGQGPPGQSPRGRGPRGRHSKVYIVDARPFANAVANKFIGAGFEDVHATYTNCELIFSSIENIHRVSESYEALIKAVRRELRVVKLLCDHFETSSQPSTFLSKVFNSGWYDHLLALLRASCQIAERLRSGETVLVHCSDGWDRTAQLTSLAMLLVDPFFRTCEGFIILIEKEFSWMGHKFNTRLDIPGSEDQPESEPSLYECVETTENGVPPTVLMERRRKAQVSPVFFQWLEAVNVIRDRVSSAFEFNEDFLIAIITQLETGTFGDFMFDCEMQRLNAFSQGYRWSSVFVELLKKRQLYTNNHFNPDDLKIDLTYPILPMWTRVWLRRGCQTLVVKPTA